MYNLSDFVPLEDCRLKTAAEAFVANSSRDKAAAEARFCEVCPAGMTCPGSHGCLDATLEQQPE